MDVVVERVAGMDISKKDAKVCIREPGSRAGTYRKTVTTHAAFTADIERLRDDLLAAKVELVVMEATGDYWKPFFFVLADALNVQLVNAAHARNVPGRKTDVSDAQWLAELGAHGLLRGSFVPDEQIRELRDLTRTRTHLVQEINREWSRLEKNLEDAGIKIDIVISSLGTVSARTMLHALVDGERDPETLAGLAHTSLIPKHAQLVEALRGRFRAHHAFMVNLHLERITAAEKQVAVLEDRINEVMSPFRDIRDALTTIPGISTTVANAVIAEIGADMGVFPTPAHLASWAGVAPGQHESAGKARSVKARPGDAYLKGALGIAGMSITRMKPNHLNAKYRRIAKRRGPSRALVALEHTLLIIIWHMITNGTVYEELGAEYGTHRSPERDIQRHIHALRRHGYNVQLTPA